MAFRLVGRQMAAARAFLRAPKTQIRGYCQQVERPTKEDIRLDIRNFYYGAVLAAFPYVYWMHKQAVEIQDSRNRRLQATLVALEREARRNFK